MTALISLCALAALIELDDTYIAQFAFSSPFVTGILFGMLTGDVAAGLQVGVFTTLLLLDYTPVGGVIGPNGTVSVFCTLMLNYVGINIYTAFFVGILSGIAFKTCERVYRAYMGKAMLKKERAIALAPKKTIPVFMLKSIAIQFSMTFIFLIIFTIAGHEIAPRLPNISENGELAFKLSYFAVPWIGIMMAFKKFTVKTK